MEFIAPEVSADGRRNAYYIHCEVAGQYRPYAACLNLCNERKGGRLEPIYADCSVAIGKKRCPALTMRANEKEAGKALYFVERVREVTTDVIDRVQQFVSGSTHSTKAPLEFNTSNKSPVKKSIDTGTYADAINAAMKTETPAAPVVPTVKVEALPGETPLEMARRLLGQGK